MSEAFTDPLLNAWYASMARKTAISVPIITEPHMGSRAGEPVLARQGFRASDRVQQHHARCEQVAVAPDSSAQSQKPQQGGLCARAR